MTALVYLHGFLSSPQSHKAQLTKIWLAKHAPDINFYCPHLTPYPKQTQETLAALIESLQPEPVWLIGSSLGGYWATWLSERFDLPAIAINPAIKPYLLINDYLLRDLKGYYSDDYYWLEPVHIDDFRAAERDINRPENYWLMVQTGDETLNYQEATAKYHACRQLVEQGGDHSFINLEQHFPAIIDFFKSTKKQG